MKLNDMLNKGQALIAEKESIEKKISLFCDSVQDVIDELENSERYKEATRIVNSDEPDDAIWQEAEDFVTSQDQKIRRLEKLLEELNC